MKLTKLLPIIGISGTLAASPALMTSCTKPTKYIQLNQFHSGSDNDSYLSSGKFNIKKNETVKLTIQMSDWTKYDEWPNLWYDSWQLELHDDNGEVGINSASIWWNGVKLVNDYDYIVEHIMVMRKGLNPPTKDDKGKWTPCTDTLAIHLNFAKDFEDENVVAVWRILWD